MTNNELNTKENLDRLRWLGGAVEIELKSGKEQILLDKRDMETLVIASQLVKELNRKSASEMGRKGGAKSKGGGRPPKLNADPKRRERYLKTLRLRKTADSFES